MTFGSQFSFPHVVSRAPSQVIRLTNKHRSLLNHLTSFSRVCLGVSGAQERLGVHSGGKGSREWTQSFVDLTSCLSLCMGCSAQPQRQVGEVGPSEGKGGFACFVWTLKGIGRAQTGSLGR